MKKHISWSIEVIICFFLWFVSLGFKEHSFKNIDEAIFYLKYFSTKIYREAKDFLFPKGEEAYTKIIEATKNPDWKIRRGSYDWLRDYWITYRPLSPKDNPQALKEAIEVIKRGAKDPIPAVRSYAILCFAFHPNWLIESASLRKEILQFLSERLKKEKNPKVKQTIRIAMVYPLDYLKETEDVFPEKIFMEIAQLIGETKDINFFTWLVPNLRGAIVPLDEEELRKGEKIYRKYGIPIKPKFRPTPKKRKASVLALKMITGEDFGEDYTKWMKWFTDNYKLIKDPVTGTSYYVKKEDAQKKEKWEAEDYIKMLNLLNSEDPEERKNVVQVMITPPPEAGFLPQVRLGILYLLYDEDQYVRGTAGMSLLTLLGGERITIKEKEKIAEALSKAIKIEKTKRLREGWAFFLKGYVKEKGIKYRKEVIINNLIESLQKGDSTYLVEEVSGILSLLTDRKPPPRIEGKELARWWIDKLQKKNLHKIEE